MAGSSKRPADLIPAARDGDCLMIEEILKKYKSHVDYKSGGCTALQQASKFGHVEVMKLLIRNDADIDASDADYSTPLHYAVDGNQPESVKLLLKSRASYHEKNADGLTPPQLAYKKKLKDCNLVFLEYDSDVTFKPDIFIPETMPEVSEDVEDSAVVEETTEKQPEVEQIENKCLYCSKNPAIMFFKPCEHTFACIECANVDICKCGEPIESKAFEDNDMVRDYIATLQKAKWNNENKLAKLNTQLQTCSSELEKAKSDITCTICFQNPVDCMLRQCGHLFCEECVWKFKRCRDFPGRPFKCPICSTWSRFDRFYPSWHVNRKHGFRHPVE